MAGPRSLRPDSGCCYGGVHLAGARFSVLHWFHLLAVLRQWHVFRPAPRQFSVVPLLGCDALPAWMHCAVLIAIAMNFVVSTGVEPPQPDQPGRHAGGHCSSHLLRVVQPGGIPQQVCTATTCGSMLRQLSTVVHSSLSPCQHSLAPSCPLSPISMDAV